MKTLRVLKHTGIILAISYAAASSASTIYKWVDEKGQTHFGQNPPEHIQAEQISPKKRSFGQYSDSVTDSSADALAQQNSTVETAENKVSDVEESTNSVKEVFKKDPSLCAQAQENKRLLIQHPIIRRQGKVLTVDEKNKELQDTEEVIKVHC